MLNKTVERKINFISDRNGETRLSQDQSKKESDNQPGFGHFKDFLHWFDYCVHLADLKKWWSSLNISLELISFKSDTFVFHSEAFLFISY